MWAIDTVLELIHSRHNSCNYHRIFLQFLTAAVPRFVIRHSVAAPLCAYCQPAASFKLRALAASAWFCKVCLKSRVSARQSSLPMLVFFQTFQYNVGPASSSCSSSTLCKTTSSWLHSILCHLRSSYEPLSKSRFFLNCTRFSTISAPPAGNGNDTERVDITFREAEARRFYRPLREDLLTYAAQEKHQKKRDVWSEMTRCLPAVFVLMFDVCLRNGVYHGIPQNRHRENEDDTWWNSGFWGVPYVQLWSTCEDVMYLPLLHQRLCDQLGGQHEPVRTTTISAVKLIFVRRHASG